MQYLQINKKIPPEWMLHDPHIKDKYGDTANIYYLKVFNDI